MKKNQNAPVAKNAVRKTKKSTFSNGDAKQSGMIEVNADAKVTVSNAGKYEVSWKTIVAGWTKLKTQAVAVGFGFAVQYAATLP